MQLRCTFPRSVGFKSDGKTICWSSKHSSKEYASFQLPCGKCIECRLEYARQWAIRCVHESMVHEKNSFITLTYSDEHLNSPKLVYSDFQKFMKRLRKTQNDPIGVFVTGEYGEDKKRPHWHAILFNWRPADCEYHRANDRGDRIYTSRILEKLWTFNDSEKRPNEIGDVSFHSAGYVARYAAKKLVHGYDDPEWNPISKKSSKHAIGKKYLEKFWPDIFNYGKCILIDGTEVGIPRYYEKWLKENQPAAWRTYVTETKIKKISFAEEASARENEEHQSAIHHRRYLSSLDARFRGDPISRAEAKYKVLTAKFKLLQSYLKL